MWNLSANDCINICKLETDSQIIENKFMVTKGEMDGGGKN